MFLFFFPFFFLSIYKWYCIFHFYFHMFTAKGMASLLLGNDESLNSVPGLLWDLCGEREMGGSPGSLADLLWHQPPGSVGCPITASQVWKPRHRVCPFLDLVRVKPYCFLWCLAGVELLLSSSFLSCQISPFLVPWIKSPLDIVFCCCCFSLHLWHF